METCRLLVRALALALVAFGSVASCAGEAANQPLQPPMLTSGSCLSRNVACMTNSDCCSLWCVNGYCETKEP